MGVSYLVASFDMLNVGDLDVIRQAVDACTELVVVVLDDDTVEAALGRPPVVPHHERAMIVQHVRGVTQLADGDVLLSGADTVFTTGDLLPHIAASCPDAVAIVPGVETRSLVLRGALQSVLAEAVA
jgi:phosphopantetheine adenylyltransferase